MPIKRDTFYPAAALWAYLMEIDQPVTGITIKLPNYYL